MDPSPMHLEIHGQNSPHAPVLVHGTRDAFCALRDLLIRFLESGREAGQAEEVFFPSDGEGYHIQILLGSEKDFRHKCGHYTNPDWR